MLHRYTIALVLMAVAAGACSQPQQETIAPETAASSTAESAVPPADTTQPAAVSTTVPEVEVPPNTAMPAEIPRGMMPSSTSSEMAASSTAELGVPPTEATSSTTPVATAVPEVEVPPSTASPAGTSRVTVPSSTSSTMLGDLGEVEISGSVLELIEGANVACEAAVESPEVSECGEAVLLACDVGIAEVASSSDTGIMPEDVVKHICHAAVVAESGELGYVLSERYSDMSPSRHLYFTGNRGGFESFRNQIRDEINELFDNLSGWEISAATREVLLGLSSNVCDFARPFSEPTVLIH